MKPDEEDTHFDKQLVDLLVANLQLFESETALIGEKRARELHSFSMVREHIHDNNLQDDFI